MKNRTVTGFQCNFVDDKRIYEFIEEVEKYPANNTMVPFASTREITDFLREQWAGLFQRYLQEQGRAKEIRTIQKLQQTAEALDKMVTYLADRNRNAGEMFQDILLSNHPAFGPLKTMTNTTYRVFFTNLDELNAWLVARGWSREDDPFQTYYSWQAKPAKDGSRKVIIVDAEIFSDEGKLKVFGSQEWNENWIRQETVDAPPIDDDDIPF